MDIKYWAGGLERHEIEAIEKIENVLSNPLSTTKTGKESQGFERLAASKARFNDGWKGYAGFRFVDKHKQGEIDLLIITHCNILVIEFKHWNGKPITSTHGKWFFGDDDRGKSPVEITRNKKFLLEKLLKPYQGKFSNGDRIPNVYFLVVMTGSSNFSALPSQELADIISLNDFCKICRNEHEFNQRFRPHPDSKVLLQDIPLIEKQLLNEKKVEARPLSVDGWVGQEEIFKHPKGVYSEFFAQSEVDKNDRAIIRSWDFDKLDNIDAKTKDGRFKIVSREREVLTKIKRESRDLYEYCVSSLTIPSKDKITSQYNEVVELPVGYERLNNFINIYGENLSLDDRINLIKVLIARFSDLHNLNMAHRDIGGHSIWLSTGQKVALSNFISAFERKKETVGTVRDELSVYSQMTDYPSPYHYDVSRLAIIAWALIKAQRLTPRFEESTMEQLAKCEDWYGGVLLTALKGKQYAKAGLLLDALVANEPSKEAEFEFSGKQLERFVKHSKVNRLFPETDFVSESDLKEVYKSDSQLVKVWNNINPSDIASGLGQRVLFFLERAEKLQHLELSFLPNIIEAGITSRDSALYLVSEWVEGDPLDLNQMQNSHESILVTIKNLISHVMHMHTLGFAHGDLKPENVVIDKQSNVFIIDALDFHHDAEDVLNTEYSPINAEECSAFERDNYAVMKISAELLGIEFGCNSPQYEAISQAIIDEQQDVDYGFKELTRFRDAVFNPDKIHQPAIEIIDIEIGSQNEKFEPLTIYPDNGKLYVLLEENNRQEKKLIISFAGLGGIQKLYFDCAGFAFEHGMRPIRRDSILPRDIQQAAVEVPFAIRVTQGRASNLTSLNRRIREFYNFENAVKQFELAQKTISENARNGSSRADMSEQVETKGELVKPISTRELWNAILSTETESHPYVELISEPCFFKDKKDSLVLLYDAENDPLDSFTAKDEVEAIIVEGEKESFIGQVNLTNSGLNKVHLSRHSNRALKLKEEEIIFFRSKADKSSFNKRKNALIRILEKDSIIENLVDYFEPDCELEPIDYKHEVTEEEFSRYDRQDDNGNIIKLNEKQRSAFQKLLRFGPLSMLQGPPGTGKTEFIAAFVHYLIEHLNTQRILLVSQSHEAVNTAAERIRKHCQRLNTSLDVVRFSNRDSAVSTPLQDVLSNNIVSKKAEEFETQLKYRVITLAKSLNAPREYLDAYLQLDKMVLSLIVEQQTLIKKLVDSELDAIERKALKLKSAELKLLLNSRVPNEVKANKAWQDDLNKVSETLIGNLNREHAIPPNTADKVKRLIDMSKDMLKVLRSGDANLDEFFARSRQLVAGTCVGIGSWQIDIASNQYDWVIIDEAARSISSELAIAMQVGKRVLLVGDHAQLPPLYSDPHKKALARRLGIKSGEDIDELVKSDFARAFGSSYGRNIGAQLLVQYRMEPSIGSLVSQCFYDGQLENGNRKIPEIYANVPKTLNTTVTWLDTAKMNKKANHQDGSGSSIYNDTEVNVIVDLLKQIDANPDFVHLLDEQVKEGEAAIGVICMYAEQKRKLRQKVKKAGLSGDLVSLLKIDTVDSYQGKENRIIILSITRSDPKQSPGFLRLPNRINVALSRAMDRLVIVGDSNMWRGKNTALPFGKVISFMENHSNDGNYAFCNVNNSDSRK